MKVGRGRTANHVVQFYDSEPFLHRAIAAFFTRGAGDDDPCVMISRRRTFEAVRDDLIASREAVARTAADLMRFVDAESRAAEFAKGDLIDRQHLQRQVAHLVEDVCRHSGEGAVRVYGDTVDLLCEQGLYATAVAAEELWDVAAAERPRMSTLCGYAIDRFDNEPGASHFRAICRHHTRVIPPEASPICVIDDDASVRRSVARLLSAAGLRVRTFASAEEFLAAADQTFRGCLVVDVQLGGSSGLDLQSRLVGEGWPVTVIAMSGSTDQSVETEALHLGAVAFLRKPFDGQSVLDAIERARRVF